MNKKQNEFVKPQHSPVFEQPQQEVEQPKVEEKIEPKVEEPSSKFNFSLIIKHPFDRYVKGQVIATDDDIQKIIDEHQLINCLKVQR